MYALLLCSHGTHCAGTISAQNDNEIGVAGIAGGKGGEAGASLMVNSASLPSIITSSE